MIYTYEECIEKYKSAYQIKKSIERHDLYKIEPGIYSDNQYASQTAVMMKKYPHAVFTLDSAFYYHGLTDTIPTQYHLLTNKDANKIADSKIKQSYDNCSSMDIGVEVINYDGDEIRVFNKERLLIELVRNRTKLPFDYYKEIIGNYRKLVNQLDFQAIEEYAKALPKTDLVMNTIKLEVL